MGKYGDEAISVFKILNSDFAGKLSDQELLSRNQPADPLEKGLR